MATTFEMQNGILRMFDGSGGTLFDSRLASQRALIIGSADIPGRTTSTAPGGGVILQPSAGVYVPYGKTFAKPPYVLACAKKKSQDFQTAFGANIWVNDGPSMVRTPFQYYTDSAFAHYYNYCHGTFTQAYTTQCYMGNTYSGQGQNQEGITWYGDIKMNYCIFNNEVSQ